MLAPQSEIKTYLEGVSNKYNLTPRMHFSTEVEQCVWDSSTLTWTLHLHNIITDEKYLHTCSVLFQCAGGLVVPRPNDIPGSSSFTGPIFHTARWNHDISLTGKRVAVIGNGCTAAQCVPALLKTPYSVKSIHQFIRSQHWIYPPLDIPYPILLQWLFRYVPGMLQLHRFHIYAVAEQAFASFVTSPSGAKKNDARRVRAERYMRKAAPKEYHDIIIPDFPIGCKRRIWDSGYMNALHKPNMHLTTDKVLEILPQGLRTTTGIVEVDAIILATGFDLREPLAPMKITGRDSLDIHKQWNSQGGAGAYSCVAVNGFPNMFMVAGPNTATGHTSVVIAAENTTNLSLRVLKPVLDGTAATVEPKQDAEDEWTREIQAASNERVWTQGGCSTWYVKDDETGKGEKWVSTLYPFSQADLWRRCLLPKWEDWEYRDRKGDGVQYKPTLVQRAGWNLQRRIWSLRKMVGMVLFVLGVVGWWRFLRR